MEEDKKSWKGCMGYVLLLIAAGGIATGLYFAFRPQFSPTKDRVSDHPAAIVSKYADALKIAMQFFDVQSSGKLEHNKIPWRGDSALDDGKEAGIDLSQGLYDAGDHMKFGFPMAYTATILAWTILEYPDQMAVVHQLDHAMQYLRWITEYLINAHKEENVLYIQVAAETAAAMAAASLVFKQSDPSYKGTLLTHAKQLFNFANKHRGTYSASIPEVATYYNSTGYGDELLWAASWLYHATKDNTYLEFVRDNGPKFANFGSLTWFTWDSKHAGAQVLLSRLAYFAGQDIPQDSGIDKYKEAAEVFMCGLIKDSPTASTSRTIGGLIWVSEWNALLHPTAAAFLAVIYSDYMLTSKTARFSCGDRDKRYYKPSDLRDFAKSQLEYILGENPMNMSYLVGYGEKYPQYVHHRGASIPADAKTGCEDGWKWLNSTEPNPNVATGALVGGPFLNETYMDSRNNSKQGEPTTYNSALLVGLLSGLVSTSSVVKSFA
ncbi:hypothetical protein Cgig2_008944 [Carnegiea gigantea]|uniref:Endoglucanase n=1 Tax=Carnegiea gigantea TaxID=171969 RepID=A0A9Q1GUX0_9CARY|nr:hypothetical protein Cgig2_008944 [Carnegiea gigantea]